MSPKIKVPYLITLWAARTPAVASQTPRNAIIGCANLGCPNDQRATTPHCIIANQSNPIIGLVRIPVSSNSLQGLSWVQGTAKESSEKSATIIKTFCLDHLAALDLSKTNGGTLFFTETSPRVQFSGCKPDVSQGTCEEAMSPACVSALTRKASSLDLGGLSSGYACAKVQADLEQSIDDECFTFKAGSRWTGLAAKPMSGLGAPSPITGSNNMTSNCWPVVNKTDSLSIVHSIQMTMLDMAVDVQQPFPNVTPISTVFLPSNGNIAAKVESQMTCMKPINLGASADASLSALGNEVKSLHVGYRAAAALVTVVLIAVML